jgi:hypothetical protein
VPRWEQETPAPPQHQRPSPLRQRRTPSARQVPTFLRTPKCLTPLAKTTPLTNNACARRRGGLALSHWETGTWEGTHTSCERDSPSPRGASGHANTLYVGTSGAFGLGARPRDFSGIPALSLRAQAWPRWGPSVLEDFSESSTPTESEDPGRERSSVILPQVHLRKPCYDFYFL